LKKSSSAVTHAARLRYWPGMTDFKVWGATFVMVAGVVGCGETANFVGTGPGAGGSGGTTSTSGGSASGGSANGGSSSKAGSPSSAGKNAGGIDAGGTGSGGSSPTGGNSTGGSVATGGTGMGGGDPIGPGCSKQSGNWLTCDNGLVHRTEPGKCESKLPRAAAIAATKPDMDECTKDSECSAKPNGFCDVLQNGFIPVQPHNICVYGCLQDADCSEGTVCLCGDLIGHCETAPACKSDKDCTGGTLCTQYDSCPGVPVHAFACQTTNDKCETDADCVENGKQFCSLGNDGQRDCVGVRCAAIAAAP
jgi:hypothetical protein